MENNNCNFQSLKIMLELASREYEHQCARVDRLNTKTDILLSMVALLFSVDMFQFKQTESLCSFFAVNIWALLSSIGLVLSMLLVLYIMRSREFRTVDVVKLFNRKLYSEDEDICNGILLTSYVSCIAQNKDKINLLFKQLNWAIMLWVVSSVLLLIHIFM